jgi:hypothetical protein
VRIDSVSILPRFRVATAYIREVLKDPSCESDFERLMRLSFYLLRRMLRHLIFIPD